MFVRYFVDMNLRFELLEPFLLDDPAASIPRIARKAEANGDRLLSEVGFGHGPLRVDKEVDVMLGPARRLDRRSVLPMSWTPGSSTRLFPKLEADIELTAFGADRTHLAISARYQPPLGVVGRTFDRAALHIVAEATVKDFLDRLADNLTRRLPAEARD